MPIQVAIIGGGAAGIAAARRLRDAHIDCLILEARSRLGGRAWTVAAQRDLPLDLGCGWLHSGDRNPWREIAEAQGCAIDRTPPPWMRPAMGFPPAEQADFQAAFQAFNARAEALPDTDPDCAASKFLDGSCRWNPLIEAITTFISGAELERISARDLARYDDSGVNWRVAEGYGSVIAGYGAGLPVRLNCPVRHIDHSGRRLKLEIAAGTIAADAAIVTLPTSLITEDLFAPALPEKTEAALGLPLGFADKLFLSLADAEEFKPDSSLLGHTDRIGTAAYHLRPFGRPYIEGYFGGGLAAELERGGIDAFFDFALAELKDQLGNDFGGRIKPLGLHAWGRDSFSRGAYSHARPGKADCRAALAAPVENRLFFAGEACSPTDFSTAHGAYLTGVAAAEQVIAFRRG
ncbi:MAG TPA: NAD(P)/FAD-dependent oxidoreductase [Gammaproteobacteria bacterium]|nr:NAD(P)/FAD-dependent oxidoreductase [Gammaproteobacteria bacterium]